MTKFIEVTGKTEEELEKQVGGQLNDVCIAAAGRVLKTVTTHVEIEYPEDEETIADSFDSSELEQASARLQQLNDSWRGEKLYQDGARIVLCGRTNAGKSSLFNGILKEERAIVSDIEGTTRDWIESWVDFNGIPVRLFDTAGLRETDDVIEAQGVNLGSPLLFARFALILTCFAS